MTANASRNKLSTPSVLSPIASKISEAVLLLMQIFGMRKISYKKLKSSEFERLVATAEHFDNVPDELYLCGTLVKDSIAEILAAAGVVSLEMSASEEETGMLTNSYKTLVESYRKTIAELSGSSAVKTVCPVEAKDAVVKPSTGKVTLKNTCRKSPKCKLKKVNGKQQCRK